MKEIHRVSYSQNMIIGMESHNIPRLLLQNVKISLINCDPWLICTISGQPIGSNVVKKHFSKGHCRKVIYVINFKMM